MNIGEYPLGTDIFGESELNLRKITAILDEELEGVEPRNKVTMVGAPGTKRSTCGFLQRIYDKTDDEEIKLWCLEASIEAKILITKIIRYRKGLTEVNNEKISNNRYTFP